LECRIKYTMKPTVERHPIQTRMGGFLFHLHNL
jgi:hypothetical protein